MIIANQTGEIDSAYHTLVSKIKSPIPIVMTSWSENFVFNKELLSLKDYLIVDFREFGWDNPIIETPIWGKNSEKFPRYYTGDWIKFDNLVKENPPKLQFIRELLKKDVSDSVFPIDYPATVAPVPIESEADFNKRSISAAYYFGRSHEGRLLLHSNIWKGATTHGYSVIDNIYYFDNTMKHEAGKKYVSMHIPWYERHPIEQVLAINGMAKIGIAPFGAGMKCFRNAEVCSNAVMLMWKNDLAWGIEWEHGVNCLTCNPGEEVETIEKWTKDKKLYSIYVNGVQTWQKYRTETYISEYITPIIKNH